MSNFKIGDKVNVLDENLSGIIIKISPFKITLEDKDGFDYTFPKNKISPILKEKEILEKPIDLHRIVQEKEWNKEKAISKPKYNRQNLEVDLHIHELVEYTKHLNNFEKLSIQLDKMKAELKKANPTHTKTITFIHGKGSGKLKNEIQTYLYKKGYTFYPASLKKYSTGATTVEINSLTSQ